MPNTRDLCGDIPHVLAYLSRRGTGYLGSWFLEMSDLKMDWGGS